MDDGDFFELGFGVDLSACDLAELFGAFLEDHVAAGFLEDDVEDGDEGGVIDDLNVVDPARSR